MELLRNAQRRNRISASHFVPREQYQPGFPMKQRIATILAGAVFSLLAATGFAEEAEVDTEPVAINIVFGLDPGAGKYDGAAGKPDDAWNLLDVHETSIRSLRSHAGKKTPVDLAVSPNDGEWGITGHSGVFHAYIYHNSRAVDLQAKLSGLAPGQYRIYVYAHGDAPDQNAEVEIEVGSEAYAGKKTLNDGTWDFRSTPMKEGVQYVTFEVSVKDKEPVQITSKRAGSSYSMFNAIQVVRLMR